MTHAEAEAYHRHTAYQCVGHAAVLHHLSRHNTIRCGGIISITFTVAALAANPGAYQVHSLPGGLFGLRYNRHTCRQTISLRGFTQSKEPPIRSQSAQLLTVPSTQSELAKRVICVGAPTHPT